MFRQMTFTTLVALAGAALIAGASVRADAQEAKPPAIEIGAVAGTWAFVVDSPHGEMTLALEMRVEERKIVGTMASEQMGSSPIAGDYADGTLKFTAEGQMGAMTFTGKFKNRDTIAGYLSTQAGDLVGVATRKK